MTLLGRLARRLLGQPRSEDAPADAEREGGDRRRRGRRGGRRRRRGAGDGDAEATTTTNANATRARSDARASVETERQDRRPSQRDRRGRRTPRALLDDPLPEDIAFRPVAEGGDQSIVPGRRRPRAGSRTTQRVVAGGSRYVTGFSASEPPESVSPTVDAAASDGSDGDTPADSGGRRRRRGRRGGRGRGGRGSGSGDGAQDRTP